MLLLIIMSILSLSGNFNYQLSMFLNVLLIVLLLNT